MPQASEIDRCWARDKFGSIDTSGPISFLRKAGYTLTADWAWEIPPGKQPTDEENRAVAFLIDEWDFDGWSRP